MAEVKEDFSEQFVFWGAPMSSESKKNQKICISVLQESDSLLISPPRQSHGVIGNTADFGSVIQGSSPCGTAIFQLSSSESFMKNGNFFSRVFGA